MKITAFDDLYSKDLASGLSTLSFSSGSNSADGDLSGGGDVVGSPGDYTVVGLRDAVSLASNLASGVAIGDVLTIIQAGADPIARFATPSNTGSTGSNALLKTTGGAGRVTEILSAGSAQTLMIGGANTFDLTLTANLTIALSGAATAGYESSVLVILRQNATGGWSVSWPGSIDWLGGSAPTVDTTPLTATFVMLETVDGGITWWGFPIGGDPGTASPLTTKGDLYTFTTDNARLAVGSNGTGLIADSAETAGIRWTLQAIAGELLMQDAVAGPPVPIESDPSGTDWLYADL